MPSESPRTNWYTDHPAACTCARCQERASEKRKFEAVHTLGQKVGRNEPCPCGSGKKYKKCHGDL
jgi:uncharacterized protein YecA (UPF0149 family)